MRQHIINEMRVLPQINPRFELERRIQFIQDCILQANADGLVLGISGGIDSTLCGKIAQISIDRLNKTTNKNYQFIALRLPFAIQADEKDAQRALKYINPSQILTVNIAEAINDIHQNCINSSKKHSMLEQADFIKGNAKARMRMLVQYEIAALNNALVLGTDHSAENITGFYTKWGDGACDAAPLFGLNKRQIRQIATFLEAPEQLVIKTPTADLEELSPQKADEDALGLSYNQIDDFLEGKELDPKISAKIESNFIKTQHKRGAVATIYTKKD